jgi:hypothetical protein
MNDKIQTGKGKPVCVLLHTKWYRFYDVQSHGTVKRLMTRNLKLLWVKYTESDYYPTSEEEQLKC